VTETSGDPRVYFAAERTLLAWIRTGIGVMAFGFVVARFGMFLRLVSAPGVELSGTGVSQYIGALLVLIGAIATAGGTLQYRRYCHHLPTQDLPSGKVPVLPLWLAWSLVSLGLVLTVVLFT
jgi:putative membrane protein